MSETFGMVNLPDLIPSDAKNLAGQSDAEVGREHLSHSAITMLLSSPAEYQLAYEEKLELIAQPPALYMGKAFQLAIEHSDPHTGRDSILDDPKPIRSQEDQNLREIQATIVMAASRAYLDEYPPQENSVREMEYRVRLRSPWTGSYSRTFDLLGFADEVATEDGQPVLSENKLVGQISPLKIRNLPLDRQLALECYGIWRATGEEVKKVRYRHTRKPSIKQRKGESVIEYCQRIERDYIERPEFYLVETTLYRSTIDLVQIEAELWSWAEQVRAYRRQNFWPRNTDRASDFGGSRYLPILLGDPDAAALYQKKPSRTGGNTPKELLK